MKKTLFYFISVSLFLIFCASFILGFGWEFVKTKKDFNYPDWGWPQLETKYFNIEKHGKNHPTPSLFFRGKSDVNHEKFLLLLGGSNTFGEGIYDTTPDQIIEGYLENTDVYTVAMPGWAANNIISVFERIDYRKKIPQKLGTIVYQFPFFHDRRICGDLQALLWSKGQAPNFYVNNKGLLVREGKIRDSSGYKLKLPALAFINFLSKVGLREKADGLLARTEFLTENCLERIGKVILKLREVTQSQFPKAQFKVFLFPHFYKNHRRYLDHFKRIGLDAFEIGEQFAKINKEVDPAQLKQEDGHVTSIFYHLIAPFYKFLIVDTPLSSK